MSHSLVRNVRTEGCDVYVGRPSKWGNPFSQGSRTQNIEDYVKWIGLRPELITKAKRDLKGKTLGCWCAPKPCHADVLAEIANAV